VRGLLGATLLAAALALASCGGEDRPEASPDEPPVETTTAPPSPPPPAASARPFSWDTAGAFVWHETDVSPEALGRELRDAGFGWVALFVHDGMSEDLVEADWVGRLRRASGVRVGGWGALRAQPAEEAALADALLAGYGLEFYIANAEAEYAYSGSAGPSAERFERSRAFVDAFRRLRPDLPAGLSSYCRPDRQDLDWGAWSSGGFVFLPQAYVNDFGQEVAPAVCASASHGAFAPDAVHPTIGMYPGVTSSLGPERYARLLERAGTVGFSVYLAETRMTDAAWRAFGEAIATRGIATSMAPS
jgi:hypothetical protein